MHVVIPHSFTRPQAIDRVKKALAQAMPHLGGQVAIEKSAWQDNTLSFIFLAQKQRIEGTLLVDDKQFVLDAKLPLMWRLFEGRIEKMIKEQTQGMLGGK